MTTVKRWESSLSTASATVTATTNKTGTKLTGSDELQLAVARAEADMCASPMGKSSNDFAEIASQA